MISIHVPDGVIGQIADNLGSVADDAVDDVKKVFAKGALNIKKALVADARASEHFRGMAGSITYEARHGVRSIGYVVGPDKNRRGGALGNIFYFGTSRGGGTGDIDGPVRDERPRLREHLLALADEYGRRI